MKLQITIFLCLLAPYLSQAQLSSNNKSFSYTDTLRGSITAERSWWDVLHYDITVTPDYFLKTISGKNIIQYKVVQNHRMQHDCTSASKETIPKYHQLARKYVFNKLKEQFQEEPIQYIHALFPIL